MKKIFSLILFLFGAICSALAQNACASLLTEEYISDGQYYSTTIEQNEEKTCEITMLGGIEYRIIACTHDAPAIHLKLIDSQGHILFDNAKYAFTNYWNFQVKQTLTCTIHLELEGKIDKDEIVLLVGYKK